MFALRGAFGLVGIRVVGEHGHTACHRQQGEHGPPRRCETRYVRSVGPRSVHLYHGRHYATRSAASLPLWITADDRLSLQQPARRVAIEQFGVATIDAKHLNPLMPA